MDHIYRVGIEFHVGSLDAQIRAATSRLPADALFGGPRGRRAADDMGSAFSKLKDAAGDVGSRLSSAFEGAVEKAGALAMTMGKLGVAAAVGAAAYGVAGLNNELEQTQLSLAAIFNANGLTKNFDDAMKISADQVAKMKQDIKTLPGTLGELSGIMATIAGPGASAGMNSDRIRKLAETAMLSGRVMLGQRYSAGLVSRELGDLLTGRVTSQNVLARNMGLHGEEAKKYKALSPEKQVEYLEKNFERFAPAASAFAQSYVAIWTTFVDNIKYSVLAPVTSPLFESVKTTIKGVNKWFDDNPAKVQEWTSYLGTRLRDAFEWGVKKAKEWGPAVMQFAEDAYARLQSLWERLGPTIEQAANALERALTNGEALDKIESILKLYAASKVAGAVGPLGMASGQWLGKAMGFGGGPGVAGALGSSALGLTAGGLLIGGAAAAGGIGLGVGTAALDAGAEEHERAVHALTAFNVALEDLTGELNTSILPLFQKFGTNGLESLNVLLNLAANTAKYASDPGQLWDDADERNDAKYKAWLDNPANRSDPDYDDINEQYQRRAKLRKFRKSLADDTFTPKRDFDIDAYTNRFSALHENTLNELSAKETKKNGAGVHIEHLDMNISGNDDPSRVARHVMRKLAEVARYPTSSRFANNPISGRT